MTVAKDAVWSSIPAMGLTYLSGYVLLDWISFVEPFSGFGVTPWNPGTGLSFLLVLLLGQRALPFLFPAPLLAEWLVRGMPLGLATSIAGSLIVGGGYSLATLVLLRPDSRFDASLRSLRDVVVLVAVTVVSSASVASAFGGLLLATSHIPSNQFFLVVTRYWVGDMIGVALIVPFGMFLATRQRLMTFDWTTAAQFTAVAIALGAALASARFDQWPAFYLLFLPITWVAVHSGLGGVSVALVVTQLGLIGGLHFMSDRNINMTDLQARMLVLAITGLVAGALVTERRRAERLLRQNQEAIAKLSRLGGMGELAITIAHEVNQPLSAAGTYSRIVADALSTEGHADPAILDVARKAVAQVERAASVIKHLRALVRLSPGEMESISVQRLFQEAVGLVEPFVDPHGIAITQKLERSLPLVRADRIQIEQLLTNLIRNSAEAIVASHIAHGHIELGAVPADSDRIEISVSDNGPGFGEMFGDDLPPPLITDKLDGLGLGLSLARSIAESHGGSLLLRSERRGAKLTFTLPCDNKRDHG